MASTVQINLSKIKENIIELNKEVTAIINHTEYEKKPYIPIEYIQASGSQFLNTGIYANANLTTELSFMLGNVWWGRILGIPNVDQGYEITQNVSEQKTRIAINGSAYITDTLPTNKFTVVNLTGNGSVYINDVLKSSLNKTYSNSSTPIYLFKGYNTQGGGKIAYCKMWNNDVLVRHLIPCIRIEDNKICMYDKVTKQFFLNTGSGNFVAGNEISEDD